MATEADNMQQDSPPCFPDDLLHDLLPLGDATFDPGSSAPPFYSHSLIPLSSALSTPFSVGSMPDLCGADNNNNINNSRRVSKAKSIKTQQSSPQPFAGSPGLLLDASSNSGGELPEFGSLITTEAGDADMADDMRRHREKNRAAQKRFRQRQKARMATSAQQVQELAKQMQSLKLEKQHLEAQNRVLQHTIKLSTRHIQDTAAEKEAYAKQQERIILETSRVYWRGVTEEPLTLEGVKKVTMESFINIFEHFLGRYRTMLDNGGKDPTTPAGKELRDTVLDRGGLRFFNAAVSVLQRQEEARAALFSDWASAAYAWNKEEMAQGMKPPSLTFWTQVLDGLELSTEQQRSMLDARQRLLKALITIRQDREKIILELGLALLQKKSANGQSLQEKQLRDSLELEREAVLDFLYTVVDSTFHPWQEAAADLYSHPWHPDLWAFCNILASRHKGEPPDISGGASGGASLLPHFSAAEMLWTPILARGAGLQLKRVLASRETPQDVLAAAARPLPTIAKMKDMTMYELFCGKHLEEGDSHQPRLEQQQQQQEQPPPTKQENTAG